MKLQPTKLFLEQLKKLSKKTKQIIKEKLLIAKENPSHFKRIEGFKLFLFRVRVSDKSKELRVIYLIEKNSLKILCILDRSNEYKDLIKYLKKLGY